MSDAHHFLYFDSKSFPMKLKLYIAFVVIDVFDLFDAFKAFWSASNFDCWWISLRLVIAYVDIIISKNIQLVNYVLKCL